MNDPVYVFLMAFLALGTLFGVRWWTLRSLDSHISVIRKEQDLQTHEVEKRHSHLVGRVEVIEEQLALLSGLGADDGPEENESE